ncbi:hypothetical protein AX769_13945 [Frondihabitans sp. PAMC 28766]|uniref:DUF4190 domain-containing protein n=1 Tax=Frondihabitans sp. PAMC 28766 TaxID=1795630 RepID=UPI00078CE0D8|nr:DUF4190 domain-containing protein [Frondihabitans sp. PAMC 28766]AMM21035.1 hypothetical protein AX769_13945 [Frondihabitans sp. PAMC 28766]
MDRTQGRRRLNGLAIAAFFVSIFVGWLGVILGFVARAQVRQTSERGAGWARAAIIIGFVEIGLFLLGVVLFATVDAGPHK